MKRYWNYLMYVLRHKKFVLLEGLRIGVPMWILIFHDWDKFLPDEFIPYAKYFYEPDGTHRIHRDETGYYKATDTGDKAFDFAWLLHQKRNKHHWQWWVLPEDSGGVKVLPMDDVHILEMIADWRGAGLAQGTPDTKLWYAKNYQKMRLHPDTKRRVEQLLDITIELERPDDVLTVSNKPEIFERVLQENAALRGQIAILEQNHLQLDRDTVIKDLQETIDEAEDQITYLKEALEKERKQYTKISNKIVGAHAHSDHVIRTYEEQIRLANQQNAEVTWKLQKENMDLKATLRYVYGRVQDAETEKMIGEALGYDK